MPLVVFNVFYHVFSIKMFYQQFTEVFLLNSGDVKGDVLTEVHITLLVVNLTQGWGLVCENYLYEK